MFRYLVFFNLLCCFVFRGVFIFFILYGHPEINYHFLTFSLVFASGPLYEDQRAPFS